MKKLIFLLLTSLSLKTLAQVVSPQAKEVEIAYQSTFIADDTEEGGSILAEWHASHMFGLFKSELVMREYGVSADQIEGMGVPRLPAQIKILSARRLDKNKLEIKYSYQGRLLLYKKTADKLLSAGSFVLPLPLDTSKIYNKKCTDTHYPEEIDYWYFYDVSKTGCEHLLKAPYAQDTVIQVRAVAAMSKQSMMKLPILRGDNGNKDEFSIYIVFGFDESRRNRKDEGRAASNEFKAYLKELGFKSSSDRPEGSVPVTVFEKELALEDGSRIQVKVRHLLVNSDSESRGQSFALFFKEAVKKADVFIYSGHSGLGGNLDIASLEARVGAIRAATDKQQIFFIDGCATYSYYLQPFKEFNQKSKLNILTNGLSSFFNGATDIYREFFGILLSPSLQDVPWIYTLTQMEKPIQGGTYLLSVGGN